MDDLGVSLILLDEETIRNVAVVNVTNASTTDHGTPRTNGLMDARMGSTDRSILCQTCHASDCAGHYGMIEFPSRVILPGHMKRIICLLRCVCFCCCEPLVKEEDCIPLLENTSPGFERIKFLAEHCRNKVKSCWNCNSPTVIYQETNKIFIMKSLPPDAPNQMEQEELQWHQKRFCPDDMYSILEKVPLPFYEMLGMDPSKSHPKNAVTKVILVLSPKQRPTLRIADGGKGRGEDDMTVLYQDVVRAKLDLEAKLLKGSMDDATVWTSFCKLQLFVACLIKNSLRKTVEIPGMASGALLGQRGSVRTMRDIEHRLKGKGGRLRGTLNAKRTDFSGRTVVGIDMCHDIWQLGVPETRMKVLTIPVRVTDLNMEEMQNRVIKGATEDGGAVNILQPLEGQEPRMIFLGLMNQETRISLAASLRPGWIIERHMQKGDWVWFNRQPTLHKMNIQAFQVYPVKGLTFRLPLPCTRPFNADFDGDEMNIHVPQSIEATTEAQELMAVPFNMVSPSNTSTIIALVQESLVSWFRLTSRNVLLTRDKFMQLAAQIQYNPNKDSYNELPLEDCWSFDTFPQPAVLKSPKGPRWTGKQILQMLLPKSVNLTRAVRDGDIKESSCWTSDKEDIVVIRKGQLLVGRLCKSTLGGGPSLVHQIWKDVGPWAAAKFVSDAQRVSNAWTNFDAICIGISDCVLDDQTIQEVDDLVATAMGKADAVELTHFPTEVKEMRVTALMQDVLRSAGALVLKRMNQDTALATVVVSGAKGNSLNLSQIMGVVGQQSIGGKRVAHRNTRIGPRGLVCFKPGDRRPEALGFVATSYIAGQTEEEFYHAMMAGREGIVATAIETATSGYNQRKMVKISEGQIVAYDRTVRISNNDIVTMNYGGDDYDATKLERIKTSLHRISDTALYEMLTPNSKKKPLPLEYEVAILCRNYLRNIQTPIVPSEYSSNLTIPFHPARLTDQMLDLEKSKHFIYFTQELHLEWLEKVVNGIVYRHGCSKGKHSGLKDILIQGLSSSNSWAKSVSVVVLTWTSAFFMNNQVTVQQAQWLQKEIFQKVSWALVAPGEAVGTIGSTSIGEPSTQGALNTFHFSGIAEKSGTTGLKRFKELLGNAKCRETCVTNALLLHETAESASRIAKQLKGVYLHSILLRGRVILATDSSSVLYNREKAVIPWVRSWMSPLCTKLDKSIETSLQKIQFQASDPEQYVIEIFLQKRRCLQEGIIPQQVRTRLRVLLQDTCLVTSTETFEDDWIVRVYPFPVEPFMNGSSFNSRAVCEALLDVCTSNVLVKGLSIVSDTFHVTSSIDCETEGGGIGKKSIQKIGTVGSDMFQLSWLLEDPSHLWTNDITETAQYLGIEAATLLNHSELQRVLSFDSTYVDPRHTMLLAETQSRSGTMNALNRHKMEELGSSLLSRASFEQTLPVLEEAAFFHRSDPLTGSLERQIVGLPLRVGTGIVHLKSTQPTEKPQERFVLAPLQDEKDTPWMATHTVAPLNRIRTMEKDFAISALEMDVDWTPHAQHLPASLKTCAERIYALATIWGNNLSQGVLSLLRLHLQCSELMFSKALERCESYLGWDNPDACTKWIQSTEVDWIQGVTIVNLQEASQKGKATRIHCTKKVDMSTKLFDWPDKNVSVDCKVVRHIPIPLASVPEIVHPTKVTIRHRKTFEKDGWTFVFTKAWKAPNNLIAEALMTKEEPSLLITVNATCAEASHHSHLNVNELLLIHGYSLWD
jgi:DNA-directed RNA polymerase II subunit RPB1